MAEYTISCKSAIEMFRTANVTVFESDSNERLKHELEKEALFIHYTVVDPDQKSNLSDSFLLCPFFSCNKIKIAQTKSVRNDSFALSGL
jgi:hypothetical protein